MKNIFFVLLTAISVLRLIGNAANAQALKNVAWLPFSYEKTISPGAVLNKADDSGYHFSNDIHSRAVRGFMKEYKDIYNVKWVKYDKGFIASFEKDSINNRLYYNKRGDFEVKIQYYFENRLSPEIRKLVKSRFDDYSIYQVSESSGNGATFYCIKIQYKNYWKTIRIMNWEIEIIQEYTDFTPR